MAGVTIEHGTLRSCVALVPVLAKPFFFDSLTACPSCQMIHPCKTVHLWLDDAGRCVVSAGVLAELRMAGMPELSVVGEVKTPPPLRLGKGADRRQVDYANRTIRQWNTLKEVG